MSASGKSPEVALGVKRDAPQQRKTPKKNPTDLKAASTASSTASARKKVTANGQHTREKKGTSAGASQKEAPMKQAAGEKKKKSKKSQSAVNGEPSGQVGEGTKVVAQKHSGSSTWKLSPFLGGRYTDLDPAFSNDERHIIISQADVLKVYSTKTSLLVRAITVPAHSNESPSPIVSYFFDPRSDDRIYIATSDCRLFLWDITDGKEVSRWSLGLRGLRSVGVCRDEVLDSSESAVLFAVGGNNDVWRISLLTSRGSEKKKLYVGRSTIRALSAVDGGRALCLIAGNEVVILNRNGSEWDANPRTYTMAHTLTCLDVYCPSDAGKEKKNKKTPRRGGDVAVGDAEGALFVLHDVVRPGKSVDRTPVKFHWHRHAPSAVKLALDGTYIVSGGLETVLVIWQVETGHRQFLPHLGAAVKRIVVSPQGASYAISLSDNSIMVLSTAELKPRTNIAGIQSLAQSPRAHGYRPVPCVLHPTIANNLLLATPSDQIDQAASSPYLQTFDTYSDRHISRQALTRTNATVVAKTDDGVVSEPDIVFLATTDNGEWLASVDEWEPSGPSHENTQLNFQAHRKREVFLKFWHWSEARKEWELVTRVDSPHPSPEEMGAEKILDLVAAPHGQTFVTVGCDGSVKIWKPRKRARPGASVTDRAVNWGCRRSISFTKENPVGDVLPVVLPDQPAQSSKQWWANVVFSKDASLLAVSCPDPGFAYRRDSSIHLIDPSSNNILYTLAGLQLGRTYGLSIIDRYLIIAASQKLLVWNLVEGKVAWEYLTSELGAAGKARLFLAADLKDQSFALAFATKGEHHPWAGKIHVFKPVWNPGPVYSGALESPVTALKSAGPGKGFMVLDVQARVQYVTPVLAQHTTVASIVDSGHSFTEAGDEGEVGLAGLYINDTVGARVDGGTEDVEMGDEGVEKVVAREALEGVFDEFGSYAAGNMEGAFDKVFALFAKRPLGDDDEDQDQDSEDGGDEED